MFRRTRDRYLYHYTSLSSLAMILSSKTLRLFPLSNMDNLQEEKSKDVKNYGRFIFVSSWTYEINESIPMWKMYSNPTEGVRIGLKENPFMVFDFSSGGFREPTDHEEMLDNGLKAFCNIISPLDTKEYRVRNPLYETQLIDVKYDNDKNLLFPDIVGKNKDYALDGTKMGVMKNTHWKFQKEVRYRIITYIDDLDREIKCLGYNKSINAKEIEKTIEKYINRLPQFIELHLSDREIDNLKITVSPDFTESNMVLLQALKEKYAPAAQISQSMLTDKVRL